MLLLAGAGLFARSLYNLKAIDPGFRVDDLFAFSIDPSLSGYDGTRVKAFTKTLLERLTATPGIEAAGLSTTRLLEGNQWTTSMTVAGYQAKGNETSTQWANSVSYGYFKTMGIPILVGRDFTDRDERTRPAPPGTFTS